jgi:hypothetical protein
MRRVEPVLVAARSELADEHAQRASTLYADLG